MRVDRAASPLRQRLPADLFDRALRLAAVGCWSYDLGAEELVWSEQTFAFYNLTPGVPLKRQAILDLLVDESRNAMEAVRADVIATGLASTVDIEVRAGRSPRWIRLWIDADQEDGRTVRIFGAQQDVTNEYDVRASLRRAAEQDPLTGLANRAAFDARYRRVVSDPVHHDHVAALVLIDIDHFKPINDKYGHLAGDACLCQMAVRLERVFAGAALVSRIGGDEFAVLLRAPLTEAGLSLGLRRAAASLCRPVVWNRIMIDTGVSIGAMSTDRKTPDAGGLFAAADAALYRAKAEGRGRVTIAAGPAAAPRPKVDAARMSRIARVS